MPTGNPSWDDLRILLALHRDKSFLAAGKSLGVAASTVARRIEALESTFGRPLVQRASDGTHLLADALRLVALGQELELGLGSLARDGGSAQIAGTVRVSLSEGFIRPLIPALARLQAKHPALQVELASESRMADIARGEADIGIRIVRSTSAAIVSKFLGRAGMALFASRDYVGRRVPNAKLTRQAATLQEWIGLDSSLDRLPQQKWLRELGAKRFVLRSNSAIAMEQAVLAGMGIGLMSEAQGRALTNLIRLDLDETPPHVDVYLAFHRDGRKVPRLQTVLKEIEAELRRQLA